MTGFDNRKKAEEAKFAHEGEIKFKIDARRRKLLGLWAAEATGRGEESSLEYALEIVKFGVQDKNFGAVINKIVEDAAARDSILTKEEVEAKNREFAIIAEKQIIEQG